MARSRYEVRMTASAEKMLKGLQRKRGRQAIETLRSIIMDLADSPLEKTQPLTGALRGLRSLHSGRFRIVVRVVERTVQVFVVGIGWHSSGDRDDIYQVLQRLARSGRLDS